MSKNKNITTTTRRQEDFENQNAEIQNAMQSEQDIINNALDKAISQSPSNGGREQAESKNSVNPAVGGHQPSPSSGNNGNRYDINSLSESVKKFASDCASLNIDAKACAEQSRKSSDKNIHEYIRGINRKIFDETQNGGFSTDVKFRVSSSDWVNVNHIIDWYRARGFEVLNVRKDSQSIAFGGAGDGGSVTHLFTISWAKA